MTHLNLNKDMIHTMKNNVLISSLFPEMRNEQIVSLFKEPKGAVVQYASKDLMFDDSGDEKQGASESNRNRLMWIKIVTDCWDDPNYSILLFSPIVEDYVYEYVCNFFFYCSFTSIR